jgi:glyoxylase-like metal-dependent hydrolase (beta-lactamase superfamily II)
MLRVLDHGDVLQLQLSSVKSRLMRYGVSAYVTRGVMIDSGFPDVGREVELWLDANPVIGAIITHYHEDHAGNVERLARRGIPVQMSPLSEPLARDPGRIGLYRRLCWGPVKPLRAVLTPFAHRALELRSAPGHSSDHHVVWDAERRTMFCGDLFIGVKVRIAHHDEDLRLQVKVLREMAALQPLRVFDGHRGLLADPVGELNAKADWIEGTIAEIELLARRGLSDHAIRNQVLGSEDATGLFSFGHYSRINFVRSVIASMK